MIRTFEQWQEFIANNLSTSGTGHNIVLEDWAEERAALLDALKPFAEFAEVLRASKPDELLIGHTKGYGTPHPEQRALYIKDMLAARDVSLVAGEPKQ